MESRNFTTDFPSLAAIAVAAGGKLVSPLETDRHTGKLVFRFHSSSLSPEFESQVLSGDVIVNAREVYAASTAILGLVARHRARRRQEGK
jgi:hypothetical protein